MLALTEPQKFWVEAGKLAVKAMMSGRSLDHFQIEDTEAVLAGAMKQSDKNRMKLLQAGVVSELKRMLAEDAVRLFRTPNGTSVAAAPLVRYLIHLFANDPNFKISARAVEPSKARRKIVSHDAHGRIKSFLEIEESIVV